MIGRLMHILLQVENVAIKIFKQSDSESFNQEVEMRKIISSKQNIVAHSSPRHYDNKSNSIKMLAFYTHEERQNIRLHCFRNIILFLFIGSKNESKACSERS